jgi:hypothetical protein
MYGNFHVARSPYMNSTTCGRLRRPSRFGRFAQAADDSPHCRWRMPVESPAGLKFLLAFGAVQPREAGEVVKTTLSTSEAQFQFRASATQ